MLTPTATITPSLTPRSGTPLQRQTQPPPIPPRATPSTLKADEEASSRSRSGSVRSQGPPPLPRRGSPAPAHLSTSPNSTNPNSTLPMANRRDPPPPPSGRTVTSSSTSVVPPTQEPFKPSSSTIEEIQRRRTLGSSKMPPPVIPRSKMPIVTDSPPLEGLVSPIQPDQKSVAPTLPVRKPTLPASADTSAESKPIAARKPASALPNSERRPSNGSPASRPVPGTSRIGTAQKTGSVADRLKQWEQIGAQPPAPLRVAAPRSPTKPSSSIPPSPIKKPSEDVARHAPPTKPVKPETLRKVSSTNGASPTKS